MSARRAEGLPRKGTNDGALCITDDLTYGIHFGHRQKHPSSRLQWSSACAAPATPPGQTGLHRVLKYSLPLSSRFKKKEQTVEIQDSKATADNTGDTLLGASVAQIMDKELSCWATAFLEILCWSHISHVTGSNPASLSGYEGAASVPSGTFFQCLKMLFGEQQWKPEGWEGC